MRRLIHAIDFQLILGPIGDFGINALRVGIILVRFMQRAGVLSVAVGIVAGVACLAVTDRLERRLSVLRAETQARSTARQASLNDLTEHLTQWTMYGWTGYFVERVRQSTDALTEINRKSGIFRALTSFMSGAVGPVVRVSEGNGSGMPLSVALGVTPNLFPSPNVVHRARSERRRARCSGHIERLDGAYPPFRLAGDGGRRLHQVPWELARVQRDDGEGRGLSPTPNGPPRADDLCRGQHFVRRRDEQGRDWLAKRTPGL